MKDLHKAIDLISAERILKVVSFLKWEELSTLMNGRVRQFVSPDDEYTALIPLSNEFSDYYKVNAARKSKVDDNTAKMQSIKWLGV